MAPSQNPAEPRRPAPRLYLVAPRDAADLAHQLAEALGATDVAAVLLRLPETDERGRVNHIKAVAPTVQGKGAALLLDGHPDLAARAGADGAHLSGIEALQAALPTLKPERIAGCGGLETRHEAMAAAEAGADYVMFGEPDASGRRPSFDAIAQRVAWWAEVFEIPCVGFAASLDEVEPLAAAGADFIAVGDCVFGAGDGAAAAIADAARRLAFAETVA
ncbi:MAG: thiamine phosphate synthase [Xanthobacteraceae bacterium]